MKLLTIITTFIASAALAETGTFEISGMTCGGCVSNIKKTVCAMESLKTCEVKKGLVTVTSKEGSKIDIKEIENKVQEAGDYKVTKSSVK